MSLRLDSVSGSEQLTALRVVCVAVDDSELGRACSGLPARTHEPVRVLFYSPEELHQIFSDRPPDAVILDADRLDEPGWAAYLRHASGRWPTLVYSTTLGAPIPPELLPRAVFIDPATLTQTQRLIAAIGRAVADSTRREVGPALSEYMDNSPDFAALLDEHGRMLCVNRPGARLLGDSPWWGTRLADWLEPGNREQLEDSARLALAEKGTWTAQTTLLDSAGRPRAVDLILTRIACRGGAGFTLACARDVTAQRAEESRLREQAERFRRLVELSPDAMFIETDGYITYANRAALELVGAEDMQAVVGQFAGRFIHSSSWERANARAKRVASGQTVNMSRETVRRLDGSTVEAEITAAPIIWHGRVATQGLVRDVSDREETMSALEQAERRLAEILGSVDNVIWSASVNDGQLVYLNAAAEALYGRRVDELLADQSIWREAIHPDDRHIVRGSLRTLKRKGSATREFRIIRADGTVRWVEDRVRLAYDESGAAVRVDGVSIDITQRKEHEEHIKYLANYDELTGLPNRNLFADRLNQWLPHARRTRTTLAVMFVGIDRLKHVNDSFGHGVGDKLLFAVAQRLQALVQEGDSLARFAGDEFTLLLPQLSGPDAAAGMASRILKAMAEPLPVDGMDLHVTVSIGISLFPTDGADMGTLTQHADTAMFRAKSNGGDTFQFYTDEMSQQALQRAELEAALRRAQQAGQLELHYQPQVELATGRVVGVEALLRWRHPTLGLVPPDRFIPLAEETGLILPIGAEVLTRACQQMRQWQLQGIADCRVSVNLSARQFMDPKLLERIELALTESALSPEHLDIELTETTVLQNEVAVTDTLSGIKALGVSVSMDDFGTGYSSLSYLKRFPIDRVKIDKSFIHEIPANADDAAIADAIVTLGHSLGLTVVAEGVETEAQLAHLRGNGCDEVQGFYFSQALAPADLVQLLARVPPWPEDRDNATP